eukprot:2428455-Ditylum_brightwellii.AAC.1
MIAIIDIHPDIEDEDKVILGGCCTLKRLFHICSTLKMTTGNHEKAIKVLTVGKLKYDTNGNEPTNQR